MAMVERSRSVSKGPGRRLLVVTLWPTVLRASPATKPVSPVRAPFESPRMSNGARTGLTGFVAGLARKTVGHNVTINNLLPGPFDTDRLRSTIAIQAKTSGRTVEEVVRDRYRANPAGRFGDPAEFGELCAFVCSAHAGFVTGQNFLIDGGAYPGTL